MSTSDLMKMHTVDGFPSAVFPFTTDVPLLDRWGTPLLFGPGSFLLAHTDDEHLRSDEDAHRRRISLCRLPFHDRRPAAGPLGHAASLRAGIVPAGAYRR